MSGMPVWLSTTLLGLGTVFAGLIGLIIVSKIMSYCCVLAASKKAMDAAAAAAQKAASDAAKAQQVQAAPAQEPGIPDRPAFVAAVSAAIATVMGTDVSELRIVSIQKVD